MLSGQLDPEREVEPELVWLDPEVVRLVPELVWLELDRREVALPSKQLQALLTRATKVHCAVPHAVRNGGVSEAVRTVVASHSEHMLEALDEYREFSSARRQLSALHCEAPTRAGTAAKRSEVFAKLLMLRCVAIQPERAGSSPLKQDMDCIREIALLLCHCHLCSPSLFVVFFISAEFCIDYHGVIFCEKSLLSVKPEEDLTEKKK